MDKGSAGNSVAVKQALDSLLKTNTSITKKKRLTKEDKQKQLFCNVIFALMIARDRGVFLANEAGIDLFKYNELWFNIIDSLLLFSLGKDGMQIINWFIYSRIKENGTLDHLYDQTGKKKVYLHTPEDLWYYLIGEEENIINSGDKC